MILVFTAYSLFFGMLFWRADKLNRMQEANGQKHTDGSGKSGKFAVFQRMG